MNENLVIRANCGDPMLILRSRLGAPTHGIDRSKVCVPDLTELLVPRLRNTPYNPCLILAATDQVISKLVKVEAPNRGRMASKCILANPLIHGVLVRPSLQGVVIAGREKLVSLGVPFNKLYVLGVT